MNLFVFFYLCRSFVGGASDKACLKSVPRCDFWRNFNFLYLIFIEKRENTCPIFYDNLSDELNRFCWKF